MWCCRSSWQVLPIALPPFFELCSELRPCNLSLRCPINCCGSAAAEDARCDESEEINELLSCRIRCWQVTQMDAPGRHRQCEKPAYAQVISTHVVIQETRLKECNAFFEDVLKPSELQPADGKETL